MDTNECVSKEHGSKRRKLDSSVFRIEPLDISNKKMLSQFLGIFWEFFFTVMKEDQSQIVEIKGFKAPEIEATLYGYMHDGANVKVVYDNDKIIGFVLYHYVFNCIALIRHLYLEKGYWNNGVAKNLVNQVGDNIKKIIFQTRKENPPVEFLRHVGKYSKKIDENDKIITWEMKWL